jgi:hypothetical protein
LRKRRTNAVNSLEFPPEALERKKVSGQLRLVSVSASRRIVWVRLARGELPENSAASISDGSLLM